MSTKESSKGAKRRSSRGVLGWSWEGFDMLLVVGALLAGFLVWFLPSFTSSPDVQAFFARQKELKEKRLAIEAEEARIAKENEELGIIYIQPGTNPFPTEPPQKDGAKNTGKGN